MKFKKIIKKLPLSWIFALAKIFKVKEVKSKKQAIKFEKLWLDVWMEEGYSGQGKAEIESIKKHYDQFLKVSTDYLVKFLGFSIGTMRLIFEGVNVLLPALEDFEVKKVWEGNVVEITLLTLKKKWRGLSHLPSMMLWRKGYRVVKKTEGYNGIIMAADFKLFHLLSRIFPFEKIGEAKFYEGSETIPAFLSLKKAEEVMWKTNRELYEFFY